MNSIAANPDLSQLVRLLAGSVLLHELLYFCNRGPDYISKCVAPVFGLKLRPYLHSLIHILLIVTAASLLLTAETWLSGIILILLTLIIASYSIRLSNHLLLSWFSFIILTIDIIRHNAVTGTTTTTIRGLVVLTYAFAAFHKLNRDYFNYDSSCGVGLLRAYLESKSVKMPKELVAIIVGIWLPVILEFAVPLFLLFEKTRLIGVLLALFLQALFGLFRNAHFSLAMCAGLTLFIPHTRLSTAEMLFSGGLGVWLAFRYTMWKVYPFRYFALTLHAVFSVLIVYLFVSAISSAGISMENFRPDGFDWLVISPLIALFMLNALSPYYSSKTEFSFAMFSNLRPDRSSHFVLRAPSRRDTKKDYVEIVKMHGMPESNHFPRNSMNYRLLRTFSPFQNRQYLKYYLIEAIRSLRSELAPDFLVEFTDGTTDFRISSDDDLSKVKHRKLCLMPAVLPKHPTTPYCN